MLFLVTMAKLRPYGYLFFDKRFSLRRLKICFILATFKTFERVLFYSKDMYEKNLAHTSFYLESHMTPTQFLIVLLMLHWLHILCYKIITVLVLFWQQFMANTNAVFFSTSIANITEVWCWRSVFQQRGQLISHTFFHT